MNNMNNKIDKFFKNKVEATSIQPSANASAKFDELLKQKNKKPLFAWWQIAASIALLLGSVFYVVNMDSSIKNDDGIAQTTGTQSELEKSEGLATVVDTEVNQHEKPTNEMPKEIKENKIADATNAELLASTPQEKSRSKTVKLSVPKINIVKTDAAMIAAVPTEIEPIDLVSPQHQEIESMVATAVASIEENKATKKKIVPITITYTPTPSSTLVANNEAKEQVEDEKKEEKPTFKSLLMAASNVSLMAEIRGAKDDLINSTFSNKNKKVNN
jgi:hypothetical protein